MADNLPKKKIVIWGSGGAGKTCLLMRHANKEFPVEYLPTVFEVHEFPIDINGQTYSVSVLDTTLREEAWRLAPLSCFNTDLFIMAFNPAYPQSFGEVSPGGMYWNVVESFFRLEPNSPRAPVILVELGSDRRTNPEIQAKLAEKGRVNVTQAEIDAAVKQMGALCFHATSALEDTGVSELFDVIVPRILAEHPPRHPAVASKPSATCSVS